MFTVHCTALKYISFMHSFGLAPSRNPRPFSQASVPRISESGQKYEYTKLFQHFFILHLFNLENCCKICKTFGSDPDREVLMQVGSGSSPKRFAKQILRKTITLMQTFSKMVFSVIIPRVEGTHYTAASNAPPPSYYMHHILGISALGIRALKTSFLAPTSLHTLLVKKTYTENEGRFTVIHLVIFYKYCFLFN